MLNLPSMAMAAGEHNSRATQQNGQRNSATVSQRARANSQAESVAIAIAAPGSTATATSNANSAAIAENGAIVVQSNSIASGGLGLGSQSLEAQFLDLLRMLIALLFPDMVPA